MHSMSRSTPLPIIYLHRLSRSASRVLRWNPTPYLGMDPAADKGPGDIYTPSSLSIVEWREGISLNLICRLKNELIFTIPASRIKNYKLLSKLFSFLVFGNIIITMTQNNNIFEVIRIKVRRKGTGMRERATANELSKWILMRCCMFLMTLNDYTI